MARYYVTALETFERLGSLAEPRQDTSATGAFRSP